MFKYIEDLKKLFIFRKKLLQPSMTNILTVMKVATYVMSLLMLLAIIYEHGFLISFSEKDIIYKIYDWVWFIFLANTTLQLSFNYSAYRAKHKKFFWGVVTLLYLTLLPVIFNGYTSSKIIHYTWTFLRSDGYQIPLLVIIAFMQLSNGIIQLLGKKLNPSFIFSVSFLIFILIGTGLLMLPRATYDGISFIDSLFTSTSAICVTGLTTVDVSSTFTPVGLFIIAALIQIGGLGVMTLTSFFAMFFLGNASLYNQIVMCDMVSSRSMNSLFTTLMYILGFTFTIEAVGAVIIFFNIHGTLYMTLNEEIAFAAFHSISAFCNAGFSTMPNNLGNGLLMSGHNIFYFTITLLVIFGGIGFPILVNIYERVKYEIVRAYRRYVIRSRYKERLIHAYNINTQIVIIMTAILLIGGTLGIALLEWNKGFDGMPIIDKWVQAFFTAACPRTAGFNSVAMSSFSIQTILIIIALMMIGGGTQSTAGGIKVNVFAVVLLNIRAILYGTNKVTVFNRQLSEISIRRSNSTMILYLFFIFISLFILTILEPNAPFLALLFEAVSALSTVGASLDLTPTLGTDSKVVVIFLMFIGRVGVLTMMSSLIKQHKVAKHQYPGGDIIIN